MITWTGTNEWLEDQISNHSMSTEEWVTDTDELYTEWPTIFPTDWSIYTEETFTSTTEESFTFFSATVSTRNIVSTSANPNTDAQAGQITLVALAVVITALAVVLIALILFFCYWRKIQKR